MKIEYTELLHFIIAASGGFLRYISNILGKTVNYNTRDMILWIVLSGGIGILAGWVAPYITDQTNLQHAIIYTSGMISVEIIKIISNHIPNLLSNSIKKGM